MIGMLVAGALLAIGGAAAGSFLYNLENAWFDLQNRGALLDVLVSLVNGAIVFPATFGLLYLIKTVISF